MSAPKLEFQGDILNETVPRTTKLLRHFGYLLIPQLFTPQETEKIIENFEWSIQNCGGGKNHDGSRRTMFPGPIERHAEMCAILDHPSILDLLGGVMGDDFYYCGGDGNYYTGNTSWHPDGGWGRLIATKTAFYLDHLTRDTGALRLIPGSHHPDHFVRKEKLDVNNSLELFGVPPSGASRQHSRRNESRRHCYLQSRCLPCLLWGHHKKTYVHDELHHLSQDARRRGRGTPICAASFPRHWK